MVVECMGSRCRVTGVVRGWLNGGSTAEAAGREMWLV